MNNASDAILKGINREPRLLHWSSELTPVKTQKYKSEYGRELLRIAEGDFVSASALYETGKGRKEMSVTLLNRALKNQLRPFFASRESQFPTPTSWLHSFH